MKTVNWTAAFFFSALLHLFLFTGLMLANRPYTPRENIIRLNLKSIAIPSSPEIKPKIAPKPSTQVKKKPVTKAVSQKTLKKPLKKVKKSPRAVDSSKKEKPRSRKQIAEKKAPQSPQKTHRKTPVKKSLPTKQSINEEKLLEQRLAALKARAEEKKLAEKLAALKNAEKKASGSLSLGKGISRELYQRLAAHIKNFWAVPEILRDKPNLSAEVEIEIAPSGKIISWRFIRRSGEPLFDEAVVATLKRADPLPALSKYLKLSIVFKMR